MITWNTDVNAPCCPGEIVNDDGRTLLIQADWDYPGTASTFGWSTTEVQRCPKCGAKCELLPDSAVYFVCEECEESPPELHERCDHSHTDGTVDCKECGCKVDDFLTSARSFLEDNDGATADDPGYFNG